MAILPKPITIKLTMKPTEDKSGRLIEHDVQTYKVTSVHMTNLTGGIHAHAEGIESIEIVHANNPTPE